ncbi:MAG TPA: phosphoenolpyruvate carboxykinase (ATP), partial [Puia sp.]|nr:phosphoenolpyruvate carboxykinase (ATP) [Puia sp.]
KGSRISLAHTRAIISAAVNGALDDVPYTTHPVFGMAIPSQCPGIPQYILDPRNTWSDPAAYDEMAGNLAGWFNKNFEKYAAGVSAEVLQAAPTRI